MFTINQHLLYRRKRWHWREARGEQGQVLLLSALFLVVLLGAAGLAIDIGVARAQKQSAQVAADAAAMAGADDLPCECTTWWADAQTYAAKNGFTDGSGGVSVSVNNPPVDGAHKNDTNSVKVVITKQVPTLFASVFGIGSINVKVSAVATSAVSNTPPCVLCVLNRSRSGALTNNGNPEVSVSNGGIVVDSSSSTAAIFNGNPNVTATTIGVVGNYLSNGNVTLSPKPATGVTPVPDPLANVPAPAVSGPNNGTVILNGNGSQTLSPGIYSMIINNGNGTLTLNPGIYVITGQLILNGNPDIIGQGVTIYFTCSGYSGSKTEPCNGSSGAGLTLNGNPTYDLTAPTSSNCGGSPSTCPYDGLTVFYDRGNTAGLTLNGNPGDNFTGTIYAKSAKATLNGNPAVNQLNSLIVVDTAVLNGNGQLNLVFDKSQNYPVISPPGSSNLTE